MKSFDDRKKAFEKQFVRDADLEFKVECKACKKLGLYIAGLIGLEGDQAAAYAAEVVAANLELPAPQDILGKVRVDLDRHGVHISDRILSLQLEKFIEETRELLIEEGNGAEDTK